MVSIDTKSSRLYYEGELSTKEIPWDVSIRYELDGKEYDAKELAGASGSLKIQISIRKNPDSNETFFDNYALLATAALNTEKCSNIKAEGATVANVGSEKQLSYTILPGKESEYTITADVTDFEMNGIAINGIPLAMDMDVDEDEMMAQVTELLDAIEKLDNGAGELTDGVGELESGMSGELRNGVKELDSGLSQLQNGAAALEDGGRSLMSGVSDLKAGAETLNAGIAQMQSELSDVSGNVGDLNVLKESSAGVRAAIGEIAAANIGGMMGQFEGQIANLDSQIGNLDAQITAIEDAMSALAAASGIPVDSLPSINKDEIYAGLMGLREQLIATKDQLQGLVDLLNANNACFYGTDEYLRSVNGSITGLWDGAQKINNGYGELDHGIGTLIGTFGTIMGKMPEVQEGTKKLLDGSNALMNGSDSLYAGAAKLLSGIEEFYEATGSLKGGTGKLDEGVTELLAGVVSLSNGVGELKDGTLTMKEETNGMDDEINAQIDELLAGITGENLELVSFVSDDNTNVDAVQFVIQTESISKSEVVEQEVEEEEIGIWQKFLDLFK